MASMGLNIDEQKAVDRFRKSVAEPSMTQLAILVAACAVAGVVADLVVVFGVLVAGLMVGGWGDPERD